MECLVCGFLPHNLLIALVKDYKLGSMDLCETPIGLHHLHYKQKTNLEDDKFSLIYIPMYA